MKLIGLIACNVQMINESIHLAKLHFDGGCDCVAFDLSTDAPGGAGPNARNLEEVYHAFYSLKRELPLHPFLLRIDEDTTKKIGADRFITFCIETGLTDIIYLAPRDAYTREYLRYHGLTLSTHIALPFSDSALLRTSDGDRSFICLEGDFFDGPETGGWPLQDIVREIRLFRGSCQIYCDIGVNSHYRYKIVEMSGADGAFLDRSAISPQDGPEDIIREIRAVKGLRTPGDGRGPLRFSGLGSSSDRLLFSPY